MGRFLLLIDYEGPSNCGLSHAGTGSRGRWKILSWIVSCSLPWSLSQILIEFLLWLSSTLNYSGMCKPKKVCFLSKLPLVIVFQIPVDSKIRQGLQWKVKHAYRQRKHDGRIRNLDDPMSFILETELKNKKWGQCVKFQSHPSPLFFNQWPTSSALPHLLKVL